MISLNSYLCLYLIVTAFYLFSLLSCFKLAKNKKTENTDNRGVMTKDYTEMVKGILSINIVLCHFAARAQGMVMPFKALGLLGGPSVTVFLCISGYAETYILMHKGNADYFNNFIFKKVFRIYFPWIISIAILAVLYGITDMKTIAEGLFTFKTIYRESTYNWFVIIILYYYIGIWLYGHVAKWLNWDRCDKTFLLWIFTISALWFFACYFCKMEPHWYGNSLSMLCGCVLGMYHIDIGKALNKHRLVFLVLFTGLSGVFVGLASYFDGIPQIICLFIRTVFLCLMTYQLSQFITSGNKILKFIGSMSLEMFYMGTGIFLWYLSKFSPTGWSVIPIFAMIIIISYLIKVLSDVIWKKGISPMLERK